jgi:hypothetical protein
MKRSIATLMLLSAILSSCTKKMVDIKSPCVSIEQESPCGPKKPINEWWIKDIKNNKIS